MLADGLILMVIGMGTVGLFLTVMVLVMQATGSWFVAHAHMFAPVDEPQKRPGRIRTDESAAIAVAVAAVTAFRKR